jgi:hypothetical protein
MIWPAISRQSKPTMAPPPHLRYDGMLICPAQRRHTRHHQLQHCQPDQQRRLQLRQRRQPDQRRYGSLYLRRAQPHHGAQHDHVCLQRRRHADLAGTSGVTTRYTQDLAAPLSQVLQTQIGAATRTDYLYGLNRLASLNGSTKTWYVADALGSVRRTVADTGMPLGVINYDPWGTPEPVRCRRSGLRARCRMSAQGW